MLPGSTQLSLFAVLCCTHAGRPKPAAQAVLHACLRMWLQRLGDPASVEAYAAALERLHLGPPPSWYPLARALDRRFVYHAGECWGKGHRAALWPMLVLEHGGKGPLLWIKQEEC
jgi:hypothetical protein